MTDNPDGGLHTDLHPDAQEDASRLTDLEAGYVGDAIAYLELALKAIAKFEGKAASLRVATDRMELAKKSLKHALLEHKQKGTAHE